MVFRAGCSHCKAFGDFGSNGECETALIFPEVGVSIYIFLLSSYSQLSLDTGSSNNLMNLIICFSGKILL